MTINVLSNLLIVNLHDRSSAPVDIHRYSPSPLLTGLDLHYGGCGEFQLQMQKIKLVGNVFHLLI